MTTFRAFRSRFWGSLSKRRHDARLSEEIETHLDLLIAEHLAQGMSPADARIEALREFGGIEYVKDQTRDERGLPFVESLLQDARFALRQLGRNPSFAITAILTLAIGIGGTTAIFSVLDVVALRPLSYPNPDRLVVLEETLPQFGPFPVSAADTEFWRRESSSFDRIALVLPDFGNLTGHGEAERLQMGLVTPVFLRLLGAQATLGRLLLDGEDQPGHDHVVVLNDALWRRRFNADPEIVGQTIDLNGVPHEVVGVLSPDFRPPNIKHLIAIPVPEMVEDMWKPLTLTAAERPAIGGYSFIAVAQLKSDVSLARARQELAAVQLNLLRDVPGKGDLKTVVVPLQEQMALRSRSGLLLLLAAVSVVLLIACVNIANLLLARSVVRIKEMTVRVALGAGRSRIARQLMVENFTLALLGGITAVAVAYISLRLILAMSPADVPRLDEVSLDGRVLLFTGAISITCGVLIGLVPAWRAARTDLQGSLKGRGDADAHAAATRLRSTLVACEIALSAACVMAAALLFQSFASLINADKGFDTDRLLTVDVNLGGTHYQELARRASFFEGVADDIRQLRGVTTVAVSTQLPLTGTGAMSALSIENGSVAPMERPRADVRCVSPGYFDAIGLSLRSGRAFEQGDRDRLVAVLSEELAKRAWPGQDPIGRRFHLGINPSAAVYEVIGTVSDIRGTALDQPLTPTAYVPFPQRSFSNSAVLVKTSGDTLNLAGLIRQTIRAHDPEVPIGRFRTMNDVVGQSVAPRRFQLQLVSLFALLTALLSALGIFGVMSYSVAQRRGEMGIRLALGTPPREILGRVMREALRIAIVGLLVATPLAWLAGRFLQSFLYSVTPYDPVAVATVVAIVISTAVIAAAGPGLRASRVDPMVALRCE